MTTTQKNRPIQITTPLGNDVLLFYRMNGVESLGELFEYEIELLSENATIDPEKILGENITVSLDLPDGSKRHFNGYVTRFGHYGSLNFFAHYKATVRPWLWLLTRTANCRIFQNKTTPIIIKQVLNDQGFTDIKENLSGSYTEREYCVQYRESDFDFVSRLMEEEGIYYYFIHEKGKHHLVLSDSSNAHHSYPNYDKIPYHQDENAIDRSRTDHINSWGFGKEIQTGVYALTDYDFKKPKADLFVKSNVPKQHGHSNYEVFDYPGLYTEISKGDHFVRNRIEEQNARFEYSEGIGNARGLASGYLFNLTECPRKDQNRQYLVVSASYQLQNDDYWSSLSNEATGKLFECSFTAIEKNQAFRTLRVTPKPLIHGTQTAVVVGPQGDEIYTDKYGRVKVQFHWDRFGKKNQDSSCWVRVSHPWAGKNWGMVAIPRIGQEVVVSFLEGNPDNPLITGSVYNANQMPPYALPANQTQSGIKSRSSKNGGTENFNELRFEDKKGHEQVYLHAEKNLDTVVENSESHSVGANRSKSIAHNETAHVGGFKTETIIMALAETVGLGKAETIGLAKALTVGVDYVVSVGNDIIITAGNSISLTVGDSKLVMEKDGTIKIDCKHFELNGIDKVTINSKDIDLN
jgi:type VI secretion system secreted protein VgrG